MWKTTLYNGGKALVLLLQAICVYTGSEDWLLSNISIHVCGCIYVVFMC